MSNWNKPSQVKKPAPKKPTALRGLIAGAAVVLVALGAVYFFMFGNEPKVEIRESTKPRRIKEVALAATNRVEKAVAATNVVEEKWDDKFIYIPEKRWKFSKLVSVVTADCGIVTERWRMPNGQTWRRQIDPPPLFENASDNAIAYVMSQKAGAPMPPYPGLQDANLNQEFANSLLSPIEIKATDSPHVAALKTAVKQARSDIAQMIREGDTRSVGEILRDYVDENNRQVDLQADALKGYYKARDEGGEEAAAEYLERINKALAGFGVAPIKSKQSETRRNRK